MSTGPDVPTQMPGTPGTVTPRAWAYTPTSATSRVTATSSRQSAKTRR
jgi:hypothetical protein